MEDSTIKFNRILKELNNATGPSPEYRNAVDNLCFLFGTLQGEISALKQRLMEETGEQ